MTRPQEQEGPLTRLLQLTLLPVFVLMLAPLIVFLLVLRFTKGKWLGFRVRQEWYPKGKSLLFAYSDAPTWKDYIEQNILPRTSHEAVVLNWSERRDWDWGRTLELQVFEHWTGVERYLEKSKQNWYGREFCPIAIVFIPWHQPKVVRFWGAFKDFKHGKELKLRRRENELFALLERR